MNEPKCEAGREGVGLAVQPRVALRRRSPDHFPKQGLRQSSVPTGRQFVQKRGSSLRRGPFHEEKADAGDGRRLDLGVDLELEERGREEEEGVGGERFEEHQVHATSPAKAFPSHSQAGVCL